MMSLDGKGSRVVCRVKGEHDGFITLLVYPWHVSYLPAKARLHPYLCWLRSLVLFVLCSSSGRWMGFCGFVGWNMGSYECLWLLAWDVVGSALAYGDWDRLVLLLLGQVATCDNPFTWTLHNSIINDAHLYEMMYRFMQDASSLYACADMIQAWFREQVDEWFDTLATRRQPSSTVFMLVNNLLQNTYGFVSCEHVAPAFRPM